MNDLIKSLFKRNLETYKKMEQDDDKLTDRTKLIQMMQAKAILRIIRMSIVVLMFGYVASLVSYLVISNSSSPDGPKSIIYKYGFDELENFDKMKKMVYFTITTISTVGFGDIHPISDLERVVWVIMLLLGNFVFSYAST